MSTSVVIVNWNSGKLLKACIESLTAAASGVDVVVVDNASTDGSLESIDGFRDHIDIVRNSVNRGFAAAVNQGFVPTSGSYVLVLNPDLHVMPGSIDILERFLNANAGAGAVGGYVNEKYLPRDLPTAAALVRENLGFAAHHPAHHMNGAVAVDQPAAAALLVRRDAYDEIAGFDERFFPAWYEDVDFCLRLKASGWKIYFMPEARFQHEGGYSAAAMGPKAFADAYYHNQLRYAQKHFGLAARFVVRVSIAAGMLLRILARPRNASAYGSVFRESLVGWRR